MSSVRVAVVGAGVAGTAAAWLLQRRGATVKVIHDRAGSSALYSGALDDAPDVANPEALAGDERAFVEALGLWNVGTPVLATREGVVRAAAGADRALLDLGPLAGKHVAVADVERDDWDAPLLASALSSSPWAAESSTRFSPVMVEALRRGHERRITGHDFAKLHDEPERLDALVRLLGEAGKGHDAWLVGPWLGTLPATAERMRRALGVPLGETTSFVGGAAGARFENARDALFSASSIDVERGRVSGVQARGERWAVRFDDADGARRGDELEADAVVLATGGVAAGGIAFVWDPERGAHGFRLSFDAPLALALDGEPGDSGGSLFGASFEKRGLGVLERVGVHADASGSARANPPAAGLFVAGDAVAARPRTILEAIRGGVRAGRAALLKSQA